eukprot:5876305-Prymnesium_polylepis.1
MPRLATAPLRCPARDCRTRRAGWRRMWALPLAAATNRLQQTARTSTSGSSSDRVWKRGV